MTHRARVNRLCGWRNWATPLRGHSCHALAGAGGGSFGSASRTTTSCPSSASIIATDSPITLPPHTTIRLMPQPSSVLVRSRRERAEPMTDTPVNRAVRRATLEQVVGAAGWLRSVDGKDVTGLAVESPADTGQRAEANRFGAPVLQDAEVDQGDAHVLGQLGQGHSPVSQDRV